MTDRKNFKQYRRRRRELTNLMLLLMLLIALLFSDGLKVGTKNGLVLALGTVIPAVFPFMIIGDAISTLIDGDALPFAKPLSCITGIPTYLLPVFISGIVSGFPVGAAMARRAIRNGADEKSVTLCAALSSNPSPAFILGAVGALAGGGIYGFAILASLLISVVFVANIFRDKTAKTAKYDNISCQKYDFIASIRRAGSTSITVFAFIAFFSAIAEIISLFIKDSGVFSVIISLLEVSSAAKFILTNFSGNRIIAEILLGFSLGFGGFSANLQALAELEATKAMKRKFFLVKITLGVISACITPGIILIFENTFG